jgi:hypothetical protein
VTTEYLHWSEQPTEFNREDHSITIPRPGNASLVLKALIGGVQHRKGIHGRGQWHKLNIRKDPEGNEHLTGMVEANRLLFSRDSTRKRKPPPRENLTRRLLR